jgi:hypothetical protein
MGRVPAEASAGTAEGRGEGVGRSQTCRGQGRAACCSRGQTILVEGVGRDRQALVDQEGCCDAAQTEHAVDRE